MLESGTCLTDVLKDSDMSSMETETQTQVAVWTDSKHTHTQACKGPTPIDKYYTHSPNAFTLSLIHTHTHRAAVHPVCDSSFDASRRYFSQASFISVWTLVWRRPRRSPVEFATRRKTLNDCSISSSSSSSSVVSDCALVFTVQRCDPQQAENRAATVTLM